MSSMEMPSDAAASQVRAKRILIGFGVTTLLGLALAGWYVGGRIIALEKVQAAPKPVIAVPAPNVGISPAEPKPADATPDWNPVDPQPGETYLQLAAMGPRSTKDYLKTLDSQGIHPRIAPSPAPDVYRILVGPYPDNSALKKEQQALHSAGIEAIVRVY